MEYIKDSVFEIDGVNYTVESERFVSMDNENLCALRYSLYHLNSIAPRGKGACGIPARGLSGQVYKGASFWDTEMFMLPFFSFTQANVAKNLLNIG